MNISIQDIYEAVLGKNPKSIEFLKKKFHSISINSKKIKKNDIFVAIKGLNYDGHDYVNEAFKNGAIAAIISNEKKVSSNTILVNDTKKSLADIASFILKKFNPFIIGITGSNGKTTTKEIIKSILDSNYGQNKILATHGNYNNDIGLPLTIFNLNSSHNHIVLEMGMSHANEISYLANIAPPNLAVITNIGEAHIENFKNREAIASEKKDILRNLQANGVAILPKESEFFNFLAKDLKNIKVLSFGIEKDADITCKFLNSKKILIKTPKYDLEIKPKLLGHNNISNILAAVACAYQLKINPIKIKQGIENVRPIPGRLELKVGKQGTAIIDDTYNANPSAFQSAIEVLDGFQGKKILVIGDMAELGENSRIYHQELSRLIKETKIDITLGVGKYVKEVITLLDGKNTWFNSKDGLVKYLYSCMKDSTILVKGSRSMKMEEIVEKLIK
ncbi:UDP-N-acetylmuramoyl-tripeptide--D-alanyl-D-alanine ligase [Methylophilales bacterium]|nr:UDP-N-acetylmuramoyl-tripeptide--D-alanyl-D-alanine ligase [Methylophilales bacterium]